MSTALIVCIIGGIVWLLGQSWQYDNRDLGGAELGRLAFFAGLLAYLLK
jgi:hypothetical protein